MQHDWAVDSSGALIVDYKMLSVIMTLHREGGRGDYLLDPFMYPKAQTRSRP
jgi:hypothetical protein